LPGYAQTLSDRLDQRVFDAIYSRTLVYNACRARWMFCAAPHDARTRGALRAGIARGFWRRWFRHDGVNADPQQLPYLQRHTEPVCCEQRSAPVPYLRGLRALYYLYIGRKAGS
jgi:hypothetical protein